VRIGAGQKLRIYELVRIGAGKEEKSSQEEQSGEDLGEEQEERNWERDTTVTGQE
jgi:hypothetical protein